MQEYEESKDPKFKQIADQLWNPMTATLTKLSLKESPSESTKALKTKIHSKKSVKPSADPISPDVDSQQVRQRLRLVLRSKLNLYKNEAHHHIKCVAKSCTFCTDLFQRVNITKCVGHRLCHATGFYPHVGTALWAMLKNKHVKRQQCTLPIKQPAVHELPALLEPTLSECDESNDSVASTLVEDANSGSFRSVSPPRKISRPASRLSVNSEPADLPWHMSVRDVYERDFRSSSADLN